MVLITREQKRIVYQYLLEEGVLVVKKVGCGSSGKLIYMYVGRTSEKASALEHSEPERNVHYEIIGLQEIRRRGLLLELVLLDCHQ